MNKKAGVVGSTVLSSALFLACAIAAEDGRALEAEHGVIISMPNDFFGYYGWPTVARMEDGTLLVEAANKREHVCPYGKIVLFQSKDNGKTWSSPRVINHSPLDDRPGGLVCLGGRRLLAGWVSTDLRRFEKYAALPENAAGMRWVTDEARELFEGPWTSVSEDGGMSWGRPRRTPVYSPHGPTLLRDGSLLWLGKKYVRGAMPVGGGELAAAVSRDSGATWETRGTVPVLKGADIRDYLEPNVLEMADGRLYAVFRLDKDPENPERAFSMLRTESSDGGMTWSVPERLGFHGAPPFLTRHSSGTLILSHGRRIKPFGQRVALSYDNGATWEPDWILRDDGKDADLGYPSTVELPGGELLTVYYQKPSGPKDKCALLYSKWKLPKK